MPITGPDLRRFCGVALAVAALGLGAVACGGGDDEENVPEAAATGTTDPLTPTTGELISQGDAICAEVNAALGAIAASTADESMKSSQAADIYEGLADRLGELGTPSDGPPPDDVIAAVRDLADGSTDTTELEEAAADYGFNDCAESPQATEYPDATGGAVEPETGIEESYVPPPSDPAPAAPPATEIPEGTGGGVAPEPPATGGGDSGGSAGGSGGSSGGIGPG